MVTLWWTLPAIAGTLTLDDANALGRPPVSTLRDSACGCIRASYGAEQALELPIASAQAVVESAGPPGQLQVWLRTPEGDLKLMVAPCLLAHDYASRLAANLGVPARAETDTSCTPVSFAVPEEIYHQVTTLNVPLADVAATARGGEPQLELQRGLMAARGTLAHCFTRSERTGEGHYRLVVGDTGAITKVRAVRSADREVDRCVSEVLQASTVPQPPGRAWLTVGYAP
ncbi:MAG: hypothetical protein ABMA64_19310 [Myxococcota bacterium]